MSYAFVDIVVTQTTDEYQNPINMGSAIIPDGYEYIILRPDLDLDYLTLTLPEAADGAVLKISSMLPAWTVEFDVPELTTTIWSSNADANIAAIGPGALLEFVYVGSEDRWYLVRV